MVHRLLRGAALALSALVVANCGGSDTSDDAAPSATPAPSAPAAAPAGPTEAELEIQAKLALLPTPYNEANYRRGRTQFAKCRSCHLLNPEGGHRIGPNLYGIFGKQVGVTEGFKYSDVLIEAGFTWTPELLDEWLANPRDFLPGNLMNFVGVSNPEQRRDLLAYLMVETAVDGVPDFGVAPAGDAAAPADDTTAETPEADVQTP